MGTVALGRATKCCSLLAGTLDEPGAWAPWHGKLDSVACTVDVVLHPIRHSILQAFGMLLPTSETSWATRPGVQLVLTVILHTDAAVRVT